MFFPSKILALGLVIFYLQLSMAVPAKNKSKESQIKLNIFISDVDDTVKDTRVLKKLAMMERMHLDCPIQKMSELYRQLDKTYKPVGNDVIWKYVSGGPVVLQSRLETFLQERLFPKGDIYLQDRLTFWRHTQEHKIRTISEIINKYPSATYFMVGDSGEFDPEIYAHLFKEFAPKGIKIRCILIREVTGVDAEKEADRNAPERFKKSFGGIPSNKWLTFQDPETLHSKLTPGGMGCN
jgi:phosphatidate phosphatase APP1